MQLTTERLTHIDSDALWQFCETCQFAARLAATKLMRGVEADQPSRWQKKPGDWVTQADVEAQHTIQSFLLTKYPDHRFLGEEQTEDSLDLANLSDTAPLELLWIVDPLDGTVNYIHRLRSFSVSIALVIREKNSNQAEILVGSVYDPLTDEMFSAIRGEGAWMNDRPIEVSDCRDLNQSLLVVSSNTGISADDPQAVRLINVMGTAASVRRLGSAALNLCYVARGQIDAYWATNLNCWDVAAGWLIAVEAGAKLQSLDQNPINLAKPAFCCSATDGLWTELQPLIVIE